MSEYLMEIMGIVLISVLLTNLLPRGKTSVLIKNTIRLCTYLCILTPAFDFFISLNGKSQPAFQEIFTDYFSETVIQTDESYIKYCSEKSIENAENCIEKTVFERYGERVEISLQAILTQSFEIKIEKGFLKAVDFTSQEKLEQIRKDLEKEYEVSFEIVKGEML